MKPSGPELLFVGKIFINSFDFCACDWYVHIFHFFLIQFWKVIFSKFHFFQVVHFIGIAHSNLFWSLDFCIVCCNFFFISVVTSFVCCNFSFLISNFTDLSFLLFFLMNLANGLSFLFMFSRNQVLVLLNFAIVSFIYFCSGIYDFFPSYNWGFLFCLFVFGFFWLLNMKKEFVY